MNNSEAEARLSHHRLTIDNIDAALVFMLAERFRCTHEIGLLKAHYALPAVDKKREERQRVRLKQLAADAALDQVFLERLMAVIIDEVVDRHLAIAADFRASSR